jgi:protocatechuate 3,4-dioxygenase, beta subunit
MENTFTPILSETPTFSRRTALTRLASGVIVATAALVLPSGAFADELIRTPAQTEGPFYPDKLPLDTDNDLIVINDNLTDAVGEVTYLSGRVLDSRGNPVRNAVVEIWQVDNHGNYIHSRGANSEASKKDGNFQGFGRFSTGSTGEYLFRTIKPPAYPGRAPHIHMCVKIKGQPKFVTQCYVKGDRRRAAGHS